MNRQTPRAVFIDRDGTLMENSPYCSDPDKVHVFPGVYEALYQLRDAGWLLVVVTNQSGIGRGWITREEYENVHAEFQKQAGIDFDAVYFCADSPDHPTDRRKPGYGMLKEASVDLGIALDQSWMVGDSEADMLCGKAARCQTILVLTGHGGAKAEAIADITVPHFPAAARRILQSSPYP